MHLSPRSLACSLAAVLLALMVADHALGAPVQRSRGGKAPIEAEDAGGGPTHGLDLRDVYDVRTYRLDLKLDPSSRSLQGVVGIEARTKVKGVQRMALDLIQPWKVSQVDWLRGELSDDSDLRGKPLFFEHSEDLLLIELPKRLSSQEPFTIAVRYGGKTPDPMLGREGERLQGIFWGESSSGAPRIDVSCQSIGSHHWWPSKAANFHPDDKPERVFVSLQVPKGLTAVSVGNLSRKSPSKNGWTTWHWRLDAPAPTWAIGFAVGPFERIDHPVQLPGLEDPLRLSLYTCPENRDRAKTHLASVPRILQLYSDHFGSYPYSGHKLALVDSLAVSASCATLVSYGQDRPMPAAAITAAAPAPATSPEKGKDEDQVIYDRLLAHELAHLWWGQSATAAGWNDAWLHESFATYAQQLLRESVYGRDMADELLAGSKTYVSSKSSLTPRGQAASRGRWAQIRTLYSKGPLVLNQLRHFVGDDEVWFEVLRELQSEHHLGFIKTSDLAGLLERSTGEDWSGYFQAWVRSAGLPRVKVTIRVSDKGYLLVQASNELRGGDPWRMPLDLAWQEGEQQRTQRLWLDPGDNEHAIECLHSPREVQVQYLHRLLARIEVQLPPR